ncbi:MAG: hypothetical protein HFG51_09250 [Lachnospiraceae bacterium]|nr:hypothetical protein [Lachnospiraceae bacterium]
MQKNKVFFIHPKVNNLNEFIKYLHIKNTSLSDNLVWDKENPDYLFVSECIYTITKQFQLFKKLYSQDRIIIGVIWECASPDLNMFDYALSYDKKMHSSDRLFRLMPYFMFFDYDINICRNEFTIERAERELNKKMGFCNFIYSNPQAYYLRDRIFYKVSSYKKVDALGIHLNNSNVQPTRSDTNWKQKSIELKSKYKFSIAAENAKFSGYSSEKLLTSYMAHSIPIYFGDPEICNDYNEKSFVLVTDEMSLDLALEKIINIDNNDDLWMKMIREPWMTEEQIQNAIKSYQDYIKFLNNIFKMPKESAIRRPRGSFIDNYALWFFRKYKYKKLTLKNIKRKIRLIMKKG